MCSTNRMQTYICTRIPKVADFLLRSPVILTEQQYDIIEMNVENVCM